MLDFLKSWIFNIVVVALFITLLEMLVPSGRFKKYINLITGMVMVIVIVSPFLSLAGKNLDLIELNLQSSNQMDREEIKERAKALKDQQMQEVVQLYRKKLEEQVKAQVSSTDGIKVVNAEVVFNENYNDEKFGEIKKIILDLGKQEGANSDLDVKPVIKVESVKIGGVKSRQKVQVEKKKNPEISDDIKKGIKAKISGVFGIAEDYIFINTAAE